VSAQHTPGPTWDAHARKLLALRRKGRKERERTGYVSQETREAMRAAFAGVEATIALDAIAKATGSAS
jgi:hypothetical protein